MGSMTLEEAQDIAQIITNMDSPSSILGDTINRLGVYFPQYRWVIEANNAGVIKIQVRLKEVYKEE
jgi:hypothetical protein